MSEFYKIPHDAKSDADIRKSMGSVTEQGEIPFGVERRKTFSEVQITRGAKERAAGNYVLKNYSQDVPAIKDAMKADELRRSGIPVPNTVRYTETDAGEAKLLITDLTEGGQKLVWSINNTQDEKEQLALTVEQITRLRNQIDGIAVNAAKNSYFINTDAYFVITDGEDTRVVVGDFGMGVVKDPERTYEDVLSHNKRQAERFLDVLGVNAK